MGLFDTIALFGTVALAAPMALLGVDFIWNGRTIEGIAFLLVAAGFVLGQQYGLPSLKRRLAGSAIDAMTDDNEESERSDHPDGAADGERGSL